MKIVIPGQNVRFLLPDGQINPPWYEFLNLLASKRRLGDLIDVDAAGVADTEVLAFNATTGKFEPASN